MPYGWEGHRSPVGRANVINSLQPCIWLSLQADCHWTIYQLWLRMGQLHLFTFW